MKPSCESRLVAASAKLQPLSKRYGAGESLRLIVACLRGFSKVVKHEPRQAVHMEKLGWACKLYGAESLGNLQGEANSVSQTFGVLDISPACQLCDSVALWLCGERAQKRKNGLCLPFCPTALALMPDTSVHPCMPLVPFELLPLCWRSEGVHLCKSVCAFFKGNCLELQWFLPPTHSLLVFVARTYGDLFSRF